MDGAAVDVTIGPADAQMFLRFKTKQIHFDDVLEDLEQAIKDEKSPPVFSDPEAYGYSYDKFNSLGAIHGELLGKEKPGNISSKDIVAFWIDGGIHAREWIAPSTAMYFIHELFNGYKSDPSVRKILIYMDFYILPIMNPDGYEHSRLKIADIYNRMWGKDRPPDCKKEDSHTDCCVGADLYRNFDWF
ncbi:hypothetical protein KIN20_013137 [Parelaphostrongylus tenuis]|uniref:Peptidase M14 domain-containing protein n=1 Tax=Parelaphostrongylus tenuis TaxID=148309 RepID=A0AAD5QN97_PARTN|nr:hypothetical protein KIN20_013137 [Parelaphostrongylus tenuis]